MPPCPASQTPDKSRRGAGADDAAGGPVSPALFHGFIWARGRADERTATTTEAMMNAMERTRIERPSCQPVSALPAPQRGCRAGDPATSTPARLPRRGPRYGRGFADVDDGGVANFAGSIRTFG